MQFDKKTNAHHPTSRWEKGQWRDLPQDAITPEWPLAIQLRAAGQETAVDLAVTMRTPGADKALIHGYLLAEGIIQRASDIVSIQHTSEDQAVVELSATVDFRADHHLRFGYTSSSCGLCGKTDLDQLQRTAYHFPIPGQPIVPPELLTQLPDKLLEQQRLFGQTGGIHAAALFTAEGKFIALQEDVGRHNALDKLLGSSLMAGQFPWRKHILLLSGRISYELVQKASAAGTPLLLAIGAPSTLAIQLAEEAGMTLVGFLRRERMNVYTYPERVA